MGTRAAWISSAEVVNHPDKSSQSSTLPETTLEDLARRFIKDSQRQIPNWSSALFFPKRVVFSDFPSMCLFPYDVRA
ncbi:hypothetical protein PBY51_014203 [Eleginops maclovinus]|uniref:Uncharacterized protein n=1 Tax=Eleginops maclovinus TaxID=56733 RepID=A0AAN7WW97_ELEMC|nr:hypothetical protein PBY51_014203 [Eleginops maclovinus]